MANLDWILYQNLSKGNYKTRSYDNPLLYSRLLDISNFNPEPGIYLQQCAYISFSAHFSLLWIYLENMV